MLFINTIQNLDMLWPMNSHPGKETYAFAFHTHTLQGVLQNNSNRQTVLWHTLQMWVLVGLVTRPHAA